MNRKRKLEIWAVTSVAIAGVAAFLSSILSKPDRVMSVTGAILREDADPKRQSPIANAEITVAFPPDAGESKSDAAGFFRLSLGDGVIAGQTIKLGFRHPEYEPLDVEQPAGDGIHVVRMTPKDRGTAGQSDGATVKVADIRMRYSVSSKTTVNVGSTVKVFEVVNKANVPCEGKPPCSPDGKWKATVGSVKLDAEGGNEFTNARVSCVAGPCPFTRIESDEFSRGGRVISAQVRNWSDTVTYLLEAEVTHTMASEAIHYSYPAIFGEFMSFTLPATAQGLSIEAEMNGTEIVYPLGPNLALSWGTCNLKVASDRTKIYSCEVKPGYKF